MRAFAPDVVSAIKKRNETAGLNHMGRTGMNSFYCWEYASPLHDDEDDLWSICSQLFKKTKHRDEYNFAYAEWGVYIVTEENCVWYVFILLFTFYFRVFDQRTSGSSIRMSSMAPYSLGNPLSTRRYHGVRIPLSGAKIWNRRRCLRKLGPVMSSAPSSGRAMFLLSLPVVCFPLQFLISHNCAT